MCCGNAPAAPESKDLLAIIHPTQHISEENQARPCIAGRLRLSNAKSGFTSTHFQQTLPTSCSPFPSPLLHIRIHHFGSPLHEPTSISTSTTDPSTATTTDYFSSNPVLHAFSISSSEVSSLAQSRFDLGVGGEGIIGRTISVSGEDGGLLGQGIIGRI